MKGCDPKTLAIIAAQFITNGVDEGEALQKANALYVSACEYAKRFASLSADEQAIEVDPETALAEFADRADLAIGDSEAKSPALVHFREIATTKTEGNITHKAFVSLIEKEFGRRPEKMAPFALANLHARVRAARSRARSVRRRKPVK